MSEQRDRPDVDIKGADLDEDTEVEQPATGDPDSFTDDGTLGDLGGTARQAGGAG